MKKDYLQQLGIGVASLTFGVALSIFILAVYSGVVILSNLQTVFLYITSFLLMLRFWWRYVTLFVKNMPSNSYWQFLFDFIICFLGILAVLFVGNIRVWALIGGGAMVTSMIRSSMSWKQANKGIKHDLKMTIIGAFAMFLIMIGIFFLAPIVNNIYLSISILVITVIFVIIASWKR